METFTGLFSEQSLVGTAASWLLVLTVTGILWKKFTELVRAVWKDSKDALRSVLEFAVELRTRLNSR
jgi:hypothetical protein